MRMKGRGLVVPSAAQLPCTGWTQMAYRRTAAPVQLDQPAHRDLPSAVQDPSGQQFQAWTGPGVPELLVMRIVDALLDE